MTFVLADIGATKMRLAATHDSENFDHPIIFDTPQAYDGAVELIAKTARGLGGGDLRQLVIGAPRPRNLPEWNGKALRDDIAKLLEVPVSVENDTALVGLGEATYGAGKGSGILVYITVSTGVNGVRIVDGRIDRSHQGFEIGGQYLSTVGTTSLEDLVSGKSIETRYGQHPSKLGSDNPLWEDLAQILAYGVHNTILHWSPDRVVFGGSMFNEIGISIERVQYHLQQIMRKFPVLPELVHSALDDKGGLWGGLALLRQGLKNS
jgi:predicted NBD/HSP70 family sugar kinase